MISLDLARYLAAHSIGTLGTDIFVDTIPLTTDNAILLVIETSQEQDPNFDLREVMVSIYCRNKSYELAEAKMYAIQKLLGIKGNYSLDNYFVFFSNTTSVQSLAKDVDHRSQLRMSVKVIYRANSDIITGG